MSHLIWSLRSTFLLPGKKRAFYKTTPAKEGAVLDILSIQPIFIKLDMSERKSHLGKILINCVNVLLGLKCPRGNNSEEWF